MPVALVEQRRRNGAVITGKGKGQPVEFERRDTRLHMGDEHVERFGRQPTRLAHADEAFLAVQRDDARRTLGFAGGIDKGDHQRLVLFGVAKKIVLPLRIGKGMVLCRKFVGKLRGKGVRFA